MVASISAVFAMLALAPVCLGLGLTPRSEVVRPFGPTGVWSGHFGVDIAAAHGSVVRSVGPGTVSFVGRIAGRVSVTVLHGVAVRTSYSYLASTAVGRGETVVRGDPLGTSGVHGDVESFHLSLRIGPQYVDPVSSFRCDGAPGRGLSLARSLTTYAVSRVRNSWRYFRPSPRGPPCGCAHGV